MDTRTIATDQASTILQDLPNGIPDNYGADGRTEDLNGLETSFQEELEDPAALLESLANYEPPRSPVVGSRAPAVPNDHDHFESLLQAAATAEGVDAAEEDRSQRSFDPFENQNKRKRNEQDEANQSDGESQMLVRDASKRRKKVSGEDIDQLALERELWVLKRGMKSVVYLRLSGLSPQFRLQMPELLVFTRLLHYSDDRQQRLRSIPALRCPNYSPLSSLLPNSSSIYNPPPKPTCWTRITQNEAIV